MPAPSIEDPDQLSVPQGAAVLGVSERTVWKMIAAGEIPAIRHGRRITRVKRSELLALIDRHTSTSGRA